jgi:hypothetical protein
LHLRIVTQVLRLLKGITAERLPGALSNASMADIKAREAVAMASGDLAGGNGLAE